MVTDLNKLEKPQLIQLLRDSQEALVADEWEEKRLLHDLQVHQIELELQNRELREAQEALETARDRYADLYDFAPVGYLTLDSKGLVLAANLTASTLLEVPRQRLLNSPLSLKVAQASKAAFFRHLQECTTQGGESVVAEIQLQLHGDKSRWVRLESKSRVSGEDGPVCWTVIVDITEQKRSEQKLKESETRFRSLFEAMPVGAAVYAVVNDGMDFIITDHNPAGERITGRSREEVAGRSVREVFPGIEEMGLLEVFRQVWKNGRTVTHPVSRYQDDSLLRWIETKVCKLPSGEIVAIYDDLTSEKQAEHILQLSEERYRALVETIPSGIEEIDTEANLLFVSTAYARLMGYSEEALAGKNLADLLPDDEKERVMGDIRRILEQRPEPSPYFHRFLRKDGSSFPAQVDWNYKLDANGQVTGFVAIVSDITQRMETEAGQKLAAKVLENTQEGVMISSADGRIISVNPAFEKLTGYPQGEIEGKTPDLLKSGYHSNEFYQRMQQQIEETGRWQGEIWNRRKSGEVYPEWLNISTIKNQTGVITHQIWVFSDISTQKEMKERLRYLAYYDVLTDLPNRQLFRDRLKMSLSHARREQNKLAVMFIDIDRFKAINDSLGHTIGDKLLQEIAIRLTQTLRHGDTTSRLGGDEFTIIIPDIEHVELVAHVASKLLDECSQPIAIEGHTLHVTISIGIAIYPEDSAEGEDLLMHADTAMYRAKDEGGGRFQFYLPEMGARSMERLALEHELYIAVQQDHLSLAYQPQVDLRSGRWVGVEALARWKHPTLGWVSPAIFIPIAEEIGLIDDIGCWVLRKACRQQKAWLDAGLNPGGRMAVNFSAIQLRQGDLAGLIERVLEETGLGPEKLEIEVTEGIFMGKVESTITGLRAIGDLGIEVAVDDFGTGYSSLSYLKMLPVNTLKIDRSFIKDLPQDSGDAAIATTIIAMARSLGLKVIAEGVETEEQKAFLLAQGCDAMQGFLYSKPVSAEEIEEMMKSLQSP